MSWFFPILGSTSSGCENVGAAIVGIIMIGILAKIALAAIELTLKAAIVIIPIFLVLLVAYGISECGKSCSGSGKPKRILCYPETDSECAHLSTPCVTWEKHETGGRRWEGSTSDVWWECLNSKYRVTVPDL